jgi:hypothetical protein
LKARQGAAIFSIRGSEATARPPYIVNLHGLAIGGRHGT